MVCENLKLRNLFKSIFKLIELGQNLEVDTQDKEEAQKQVKLLQKLEKTKARIERWISLQKTRKIKTNHQIL